MNARTRIAIIASFAVTACSQHHDAGTSVPAVEQATHDGKEKDASAGDASASTDNAGDGGLAQTRSIGALELVATVSEQMLTGVAVSREGRIFLNFPHWVDPITYTVAELREGKPVPYPDAKINAQPPADPATQLVSVQSVVVDPKDRLWILDTGSINMGPVIPGAPKMIGIDLATDRAFTTIHFPADVVLPTSYANDVRFDLTRGSAGYAFITDSSATGPNGIIVVDLATEKSWRKLNDHPTTKAEPSFLPIVEGEPIYRREPGKPPQPFHSGSDGIAISPARNRLYYTPLSSRKLYSVAIDALVDPNADAAATVEDLGEKGASDGLEADAQGTIYATAYEQNAVLQRKTGGVWETLVSDPRLLWPDSLSVANGWIYVTANQLHRQPQYHDGKDLRQRPFALFRAKIDAAPVCVP
jgi:sugar lactone lactonase YvrE